MSTCTPEEYQHDGGFSIVGLPVLTVTLLVTAVALGGLASFIGRWFYLVFLFPFLIGLGLAAAGAMAGHLAKMRNVGIAVLLGLTSAAATMLAMHYCDYRHWISMRDAAHAEMGREMVEDVAKEDAAVDSFSAFMNHQAMQGVTIGKRAGGWNIGYYGTWIYWSLEFLGVATLATFGLVGRATAPFCPGCGTWKDEGRLGTLQGEGDEVVAILKEGDVPRLARHKPAAEGGSLLLSAAVCPNCKDQSTIAVKLEKVTKNAKGEEAKSELTHLSFPGEALAGFEKLFAGPDRKT